MNRANVLFAVILLTTVVGFSCPSEAGLKDLIKGAETALNLFNKDVHGKLRRGFTDLTAEEEYYIGRAVSAQILARYKVYEDPARNTYLNTLGQLLTWSSSRPEVFGGFHFTLIQADEINAFAAPGGFIFLTTGLYLKLENEEQLAAVLAHEIAHVNLQHGLKAIKKSNLTQAFTIIGMEAAKESNQGQVMQLSGLLGQSVDNIVNQLIVSGYSKGQEYDADEEALQISYRAGFNPDGLEEFLVNLQKESQQKDSKGFNSTHPPADKRIKNITKYEKKNPLEGATEELRSLRFANLKLLSPDGIEIDTQQTL